MQRAARLQRTLVPGSPPWRSRAGAARPGRTRALAPATALTLSLALTACRPSVAEHPAADGAQEVEVERVALSLLARPDLWTVVSSGAEAPGVETLSPAGQTHFDSSALPTLVMTPPSEVHIRLPDDLPAGTLHFATGIDRRTYSWDEPARVRFELLLDAAPAHDETRPLSSSVRRMERDWTRGSAAVRGGMTLTLRTSSEGEVPARARLGFGLLEVTTSQAVRRIAATPTAPNVLVVLVDTLRADRLGCYGYERDTSPHLDAFAERGLLCERAYAPSSWTWPSTASLLTGLTPPEHGVLGAESCYVPEDLTTLAEALQDAGARTAAFSANPIVAAEKNFDQGFESFVSGLWPRAPEVVDDALHWLRDASDRRFFLYLHLADPHVPYAPDEDLRARFAPGSGDFDAQRTADTVRHFVRTGEGEAQALSGVALARRLYDAEVATVDRALGRLFAGLAELGVEDRTLVAVTSDHGEEFLEHGVLGHGKQLYRETLEVPLLLAGPGVAPARRRAPAEMRWLGGNLLRLAGVDVPAEFRAPDLLAEPGPDQLATPPLFFTTSPGVWNPGPGHTERVPALYGCLDGALWLAWAPREGGGAPRTQLFDLVRDPAQVEDRAADQVAEVQRLQAAIDAWRSAGSARRAGTIDGGEGTRALLRELGYLDPGD